MKLDVLIAHPLKHHVFNLAVGCQKSNLSFKLITPLYKKGFIGTFAFIPGTFGKKMHGYYYKKLNSNNVISPFYWQLKRILCPAKNIVNFQASFDLHVQELILTGKIKTKILITMQDYMPNTVAAAYEKGITIWSDQILNRSPETRALIFNNLVDAGVHDYEDIYNEEDNNKILLMADIITAPSNYTLSGLFNRLPPTTKHFISPYGVDPSKFNETSIKSSNNNKIVIIARANNVRKGGHLLLSALENIGENLVQLAAGKEIEVAIIGSLDHIVSKKLFNMKFANGLSVKAKVIPSTLMAEEFMKANLFVMPSLSEGMSLMCVEAMQMKLPLIITKECGIDCFKNLKMGIEVEGNATSLSKGLIFAFENQRQWSDWGNACKTEAENLTWSHYESEICKIVYKSYLHHDVEY
jgi:hypothetical protein